MALCLQIWKSRHFLVTKKKGKCDVDSIQSIEKNCTFLLSSLVTSHGMNKNHASLTWQILATTQFFSWISFEECQQDIIVVWSVRISSSYSFTNLEFRIYEFISPIFFSVLSSWKRKQISNWSQKFFSQLKKS